MDAIRKCFPCVGAPATSQFNTNNPEKQHNVIMKYYDDPALEFIARQSAGLPRRENIANSILNGITNIIKDGAKMGEAMKKAVTDATDKALEFAKEHPYYTVLIGAGTIVAIGVLVMLAPWVLEVLGFAARGPRAASVAARWMSEIAKANNGGVPAGSIYSFLQSLGMTWAAGVYEVSEKHDSTLISG